jgi:hypothetical protein
MPTADKGVKVNRVNENLRVVISTIPTHEVMALLRQRLVSEPTDKRGSLDASLAMNLCVLLAGIVRNEQYNNKDNFYLQDKWKA